ncbi:MAG: hypothetical protein RIF34_10975, partial [Candidatus Kapaibacterium sp.]
ETYLDSASGIKDSTEMVPVVIYQDTLFYLLNGLGSKEIKERASDISRKSEGLINDFSFDKKKLIIDSTDFTTFIRYEEDIIVAIGAEDEKSFDKTRIELAKLWLGSLAKKIELEHKDRSYKSILINVGITILILIAFFFFIKYVNKFFRFLSLRLHSLKDTVIKDIKLKQVKLLDSNNLLRFAIIALKGIKVIFILFCLYFVFPIVFGLFPWTKGLSEKLYGYVLDPLKGMILSIINYIPNLITIIVIVVVARYVVKFLKFISNEIKHERLTLPNFYPEWAKPTF